MSSLTAKKCRLFDTSLRCDLVTDDVINEIKSCWSDPSYDCSKLESLGVEIVKKPFPVCIIKNFISSEELLKSVVQEVKDVTFKEKFNDLYLFKQSQDIQNLKNYSFIPQVYDLLKNEAWKWVNKTLGNDQLKQEVSATFSLYSNQDRLLCHDDQCENRQVAFILYLVEDWNEEDGGALQLFNTDDNGFPKDVVKSILPEFNTMVLFEVTSESYHQVSEVTSKTKKRLSLNGWFYTSNEKTIHVNYPLISDTKNFGNDKDLKLEDYFLPIYFNDANKMDIRDRFLKNSEIELENFINPIFWQTVVNDFKNNDIKWSFVGPASVRKYEVAELSSLPDSIQVVKEIFESKCWFRYLKELTGLDFAPSKSSDMKIWKTGIPPYVSCEVQRWTHSCYTVVNDKDPQFQAKYLDVILRIPFRKDKKVNHHINGDKPASGHIIYFDACGKRDECLLHIGYKMNSLALIYRDTKTLRFTEYLTSAAEPYYQIFCTYKPWRPPNGQPKLKHCEDESESESSTSNSDNSSEDEYFSE